MFIHLAALCLDCGVWGLIVSCRMWDLVARSGITSGLPALGTWSLSHWTTREVPLNLNLILIFLDELTEAYIYLTS